MSETNDSITDHLIDCVSGKESACATVKNRRNTERHPYTLLVGLVLLDENRELSPPLLLRARDLSLEGIGLSSRGPLDVGKQGVLQLVRSNGNLALAGVEVMHCRYVKDLEHVIGLGFIPMPPGFRTEDFLDDQGRLTLFDPLLQSNLKP